VSAVAAPPATAKMQALVLTAPHEFEIRDDQPIPRPSANEVLARVRAIAICGTDAEIVEGTF
jgi:L-iditol 2-dehydrogenase